VSAGVLIEVDIPKPPKGQSLELWIESPRVADRFALAGYSRGGGTTPRQIVEQRIRYQDVAILSANGRAKFPYVAKVEWPDDPRNPRTVSVWLADGDSCLFLGDGPPVVSQAPTMSREQVTRRGCAVVLLEVERPSK